MKTTSLSNLMAKGNIEPSSNWVEPDEVPEKRFYCHSRKKEYCEADLDLDDPECPYCGELDPVEIEEEPDYESWLNYSDDYIGGC